MTEKTSQEIQTMDFETAFTALQENLGKLEGEDLPLEKALAAYERGQALAQHCAAILEKAELKIRQLTDDPSAAEDTEA